MNNDSARVTTSPVLFGYRGRDGRLTLFDARRPERMRLTGHRGAQVLTSFLDPRPGAAAEDDDGFSDEDLAQAREAGLLVSEGDNERLALWERHGWSRPAYLVFSQMDIPFREDFEDASVADLTTQRRSAVVDYQSADPYPAHRWLARGEPVGLPAPSPQTRTLTALTSRRSARGFSPSPPHVQQMADTLYAATEGFRMVASDRASGDPFRLLNSLYSWAHLFVVVQDVEGASGGVFEYDWSEHRLLGSAPAPSDAELLACVQGQRWVLGSGFVIFLVADLRGYAWLYRHSRAYMHVLIQVGELGQELFMAASELGLAGWTTPAVHESRSAALLGLPEDDAVDVLSMVRLGRPLRRPSTG